MWKTNKIKKKQIKESKTGTRTDTHTPVPIDRQMNYFTFESAAYQRKRNDAGSFSLSSRNNSKDNNNLWVQRQNAHVNEDYSKDEI